MDGQTEECCQICRQPTNDFHFGVQSCRACSAFFRRSISHGRTYKCYRVGKCKVEAKTTNCRACRFVKCLRVGMQEELVQNRPNVDSELDNDLRVVSATKYKTSSPLTIILNPSKDNLNALEKMNNGLLDYSQQQRFLFSILYPEKDANKLYFVSFDENVQMERGCLSLIMNALNNYFPAFSDLDPKLKKSVFRSTAYHFSMFFQNFQTMETFKDPADWHFLLHHGQVLDCKQVDYFHRNDRNPKVAMRQSIAVGNHCVKLIRKMRELPTVKIYEIAALLGIRLWNEVGIQSPSHANFAEKQRNHIYKCLHDKIEQNYPLPMASTRLGNLLLLLNYLEPIVTQLIENMAMDRIFGLYKKQMWDE